MLVVQGGGHGNRLQSHRYLYEILFPAVRKTLGELARPLYALGVFRDKPGYAPMPLRNPAGVVVEVPHFDSDGRVPRPIEPTSFPIVTVSQPLSST
ncbi:hypothetical protein PAXINDRAFT_173481 [Paxillus involutus ATCC 200175]|uniref:Uncharacterized protein n=1 Tax=Paxillus involutus ATCC 200175 TaxID=664439 RepID=A0A0C9SWZ4_PAXIN|nr:hypothetical protein PAXINDRAFT_173481 [Paxillus involutus ATCC 200175]